MVVTIGSEIGSLRVVGTAGPPRRHRAAHAALALRVHGLPRWHPRAGHRCHRQGSGGAGGCLVLRRRADRRGAGALPLDRRTPRLTATLWLASSTMSMSWSPCTVTAAGSSCAPCCSVDETGSSPSTWPPGRGSHCPTTPSAPISPRCPRGSPASIDATRSTSRPSKDSRSSSHPRFGGTTTSRAGPTTATIGRAPQVDTFITVLARATRSWATTRQLS